jgi:hypothetical protein
LLRSCLQPAGDPAATAVRDLIAWRASLTAVR